MKHRLIALLLAAAAGALAWTGIVGEPQPGPFTIVIPVISTDWRVVLGLFAACIVLAMIAVLPSKRQRWSARSRRENAQYMSGKLSNGQYWERVHQRDAQLKGMSPGRRQRINGTR